MTDTASDGGPPPARAGERWQLVACVLVTLVAFSAIEVVANPIREQIHPLAMTFWRFLLGTLCLWPWLLCRRGAAGLAGLATGDLAALAGLGVLNVIVAMGAHAVCIRHASAGTAAILIAANPVATNLFAWLLRGEALGPRRVLALAGGLVGVVLVVSRGALAVGPGVAGGGDTPLGVLAGVGAAAGFGLYTVLSKGPVARHGSLVVTVVGFSLGVLIDLPLLWGMGIPIWPAPGLWPRLLLLGLVVSGIGYVTFFEVLARLPAGRTSLLFFGKPPVSMAMAWLLLSELPPLRSLAGTALIMAAIAGDRPAPPPPPPAASARD